MQAKILQKFAFDRAIDYLEKDPEKNLPKLMEAVDKFAGEGPNSFPQQRNAIRNIINDPSSNMYQLMMRLIRETDPEVLNRIFYNFFFNANLVGWQKQEEVRQKYHCNVPWAILLDPTSACNLHCTGCWAAEYGNKLNLTFEDIDSIIEQGKEMGVYLYIYTGGEPLVRKADLIRLCEKHSDCVFLSFTNATLIDEAFANEMLRVKNFIPSISVEGFEEATDARRGAGTFNKVTRAMALLKDKKLPFGLSCCYTSQNLDSLTSEAYFDQMVAWGAAFVWFFHYMPVGADAVPELMVSPKQREFIYHKIRGYRKTKSIFAMDFQNDGEYVGGCIAGGRRYLHINANGDADPCVFIHFSDANIHEKTLLEVLTSPLFMAYHDGQPFCENHLRPCPMLENPEKLREIITRTGAASTDLQHPETVDELCDRCVAYADHWEPAADYLWAASHPVDAQSAD